jgi:hypothetical protein
MATPGYIRGISRFTPLMALRMYLELLKILRSSITTILGRIAMRSELVFGAMTHISNRYLLTRLAARATRKFHRPNTRIQDTTNDVFERFTRANPIAAIRSADSLQSLPFVVQVETHSVCEDLERSVA